MLVFSSVHMINYVYSFAYGELSLNPREEADLIMVDKLFDVLLDLVCQYFIENFSINLHQGYWPEIFLLLCLQQVLVSGWWWPHKMS